jgi:hypothetical protein
MKCPQCREVVTFTVGPKTSSPYPNYPNKSEWGTNLGSGNAKLVTVLQTNLGSCVCGETFYSYYKCGSLCDLIEMTHKDKFTVALVDDKWSIVDDE